MRGPDGRAWSFSRKFPIRRFSTNIVLSALLAAGAPVAVMAQAASDRADFVASLFTGKEQYENFNRIDALFPTDKVAASDHPEPLETGKAISLPAAFAFDGTDLSTEDFLAATDTAALLVLKDGKIVHETYRLTGGPDVRWLSMSVGKSVVSALVGTAIADGAIKSVDEPVTTYLPGLAGSAYDGVKIKDILQMSSGAQWREEYSDGESTFSVLERFWHRALPSRPFRRASNAIMHLEPSTVIIPQIRLSSACWLKGRPASAWLVTRMRSSGSLSAQPARRFG